MTDKEKLKKCFEEATRLINYAANEIMTLEQVSKWEGARGFMEWWNQEINE